jgi:uncharacterized protein YecE (DUF72 family)
MPSSNIQWRIGCSGFHYADWKKVFYPEGLPQRKWFEYYCTIFNTLELNTTFYRFPQVRFLKNWYDQSPAGFEFSVKAPRLITHYKQFIDCKRYLSDFYTTARDGLQEKLGCILFQLPSRIKYDKAKLSRIIEGLDPAFKNVVEFRDAGWWKKSVYAELKKHHIIFCGMSHPSLPDEPVCNTTTAYYRFHGVPRLYYSQYKKSFLQEVVTKIQSAKKVEQGYLYFNNTATLAAIRNAKWLDGYVERETANVKREKGVLENRKVIRAGN